MADRLKYNANLIEALGTSLRSGDHALDVVPALLKRVLQEEAWRDFVTGRGDVIHYDSFAEFVSTAPLKGLGGSVDLVARIVADDPEAMALLTIAMQRSPGRPPKTVNNVHGKPEGNSSAAGHRKLAKHRPDLHARVLTGELKVHAALTEGGLKSRSQTVSMVNATSAANTLRAYMDPVVIAELIVQLQDHSR